MILQNYKSLYHSLLCNLKEKYLFFKIQSLKNYNHFLPRSYRNANIYKNIFKTDLNI